VLATTVMSGCGGPAPAPDRPPAPASPIEITVKLEEHRFDFGPAFSGVPAGRVVFRMVNVGQETHIPSLVPLEDDVPPIDAQVRGAERRIVQTLGGVNDRLPGETGTFAVDLVAGRRYAFICYATGPDGVAHSQKGMTWEGRALAQAPGPAPAQPPASATKPVP